MVHVGTQIGTDDAARPAAVPPRRDLSDPSLYINRELSWLEFNRRVLEEAQDMSSPLYERLKFLGIVSSNLDEFFMVRVAGLKQQIIGGVAETPADGMTPADQLVGIAERCHRLVDEQYRAWREDILPALQARGITLLTRQKMTPAERKAAQTQFMSQVFPALTPLAVDPGHPFPHLRNKSINVAVLLEKDKRRGRRRPGDEQPSLAVIQVPIVLNRLVQVITDDAQPGQLTFIGLGERIASFAGELFPGYTVRHSCVFRVTRNWDITIDEEESEDLMSTIQDELRRRDRGAAVRVEIETSVAQQLEQPLCDALKVSPQDVYRVDGPLQLQDFVQLVDWDPRAHEQRAETHVPVMPAAFADDEPIRNVVAERDVVLHHPYESFDPVVRFIEEAVEDPQVLAIKMTLYRTSGDSPFVRALTRAAEAGKQVAVLVELKARFDEANNIAWARRLEQSGVHVVYGLIGLKTHCKVAMVVRREATGIRRYVHFGTGNYNPTTARLYTDVSILTSRQELADDVTALFNMLTGFSEPPKWKRLAVAPVGLRDRVVELIGREAEFAKRGEPARIVAKMNSLVDPVVIQALYEASQAGVEMILVVRGICCLRPGVAGVSENIRVLSVVDRFLEHSRLSAFGVGPRTEVYGSSADWMPRNFLRRIEVMYPIEDSSVKRRLLDEVLDVTLRDNVKARELQVDGSYLRLPKGEPVVQSQRLLGQLARDNRSRAPTKIRHAAAPSGESVDE